MLSHDEVKIESLCRKMQNHHGLSTQQFIWSALSLKEPHNFPIGLTNEVDLIVPTTKDIQALARTVR